jgi:heme exporter protein D
MSVSRYVQNVAETTPRWVDFIIIGGSAALSWLAPVASLVAIVWGCIQIFDWFEKRRREKRKLEE